MAAFVELENKDELIAELREKFKKKYVDSSSPKLAKFDDQDINRIFNDDLYALSFLNWKKGVLSDSLDMVAQVLEWRKENDMRNISVDSVGNEFVKRGICYIHGRGVDGKRVMCLVGRLQTKNDKDKVRKLLMLWLERLQRTEPCQHITFILDTHKTAMTNVDLGSIRFIIDSFSIYFPDLLERIIILDMPWIMNAIWKVVKQWMSEEQRSRVVFCSRQELVKFVAKDQLPESMNGTSDWTFSFPPFPDDVSLKFDFRDDPMNFKQEASANGDELPNQSGLPNESDETFRNSLNPSASSKQNNESIPRSKSSDVVEVDAVDDEAGTSTSFSIPTTPTKDSAGDTKRLSETRRHSTKEPRRHSSTSQSPNRKGQGELRRRHTGGALTPSSLPQNVSFKSVSPTSDGGDFDTISSGSSRKQADVNLDEITLGKLLVMSPVSVMTFKKVDDKLECFLDLRNPNPAADDVSDRVNVAFKIKTTSPEKYHVKPSVGILGPGESISIHIYIETGHEASMPQDRFLLLYKTIAVEDIRPSHGDIIKFWRANSDKKSHSEHRVRVRLEGAGAVGVQNLRVGRSIIPNGVDTRGPSKEPVTSQSHPGLFKEKESSDVMMSQLQQQILLLNNKVIRLESDSRWIRRRLRHSMGLLFLIIVLLLILLKEVLVLSSHITQPVKS